MKCKICHMERGGNNGLRFGVCWDCATAESIIEEGVDMDDKAFGINNEPAKTAMDKVRLLVAHGWRPNA